MSGALFVVLGLQLSLAALRSSATDNPHNGNNSVECINCHDPVKSASTTTWWTDQEANVCGTCHNTANPRTGTDVMAHKKNATTILAQCTACHDPHRQQQMRIWKTEGYLYSGISDTVGGIDPTYTILTCSTATWSVNQWQNMVLVPNVNAPAYNYRIASNTGTTITINTNGTAENAMLNAMGGQTFAIVFGKLVKQSVNGLQVKFYRETGTNSFADGDLVANGICQVCHTQTKYFRKNAAVLDQGHPTPAGVKCVTCHNHQVGFRPTCNNCHGNPPVDATVGGPTGLAKDSSNNQTGSTTAGAHSKHATAAPAGYEYTCDTCHFNSAGSGATHNNGLVVTMGFKSFGSNLVGGSYDGQTTVSYNTSTNTTTVSSPGSGALQCSNIYCHSTVQSGADGTGAPTYATPAWNGLGTVVCGSCHRADGSQGLGTRMNSGSHSKHLDQATVTCNTCHQPSTGTTHVNGSIDMVSGLNYSGSPAPQAGFSTCSTAACHNAYGTSGVATPTWGIPSTCGSCHPVAAVGAPDTGSHTKHLASPVIACADCHMGAVKDTSGGPAHGDGDIDVTNGYPANVAKHAAGSGYSSCSSAACHNAYGTSGVATPTWGTGSNCGSCHAIAAVGAPDTGSHTKHLASPAITCADCHAGAVKDTSGGSAHGDGDIDVTNGYPANVTKHTAGSGYSSCSSAACHNAYGTNGVATPTWGTPSTCGSCHAIAAVGAPDTGSHTKHLASSAVTCADCHAGAVKDTSGGSAHGDGDIDVTNGYPANVAKHAAGSGYSTCTAAYCHSSGQSLDGSSATPVYQTVTWGGTAACGTCHKTKAGDALGPIDTGSHTKHMASVGTGVNGCGDCHAGAANDASSYNSVLHINRSIDVVAVLNYTLGGAPGNGYGQCSTAACHSNGKGSYSSATWGNTSPGCTFCHPTLSGRHSSHVIFTNSSQYGNTSANYSGSTSNYDFGCGNCHPTTANHMNGTVELSLNPADGGTLKAKNSGPSVSGSGNTTQCNGVYCHSNGQATPSFVQTPQWGGSFADANNTCGQCHGNYPVNGAHALHAVGIHFEDVYNGSSGKIAATGGAGSGAAHGDPAVSTTISCNVCHAATLSKSRNKFGSACNSCHNGDAASTAIVSGDLIKTIHVDGTRNVSFAAIQVKSRSQLRDDITTIAALNTYWQRMNNYKAGATSYDQSKGTLAATAGYAGGSCSAVVCHNGFLVSWTATISCDGCHSELPQ